jgi:nascent polypeptide-associated complex subunit alpha
MQQLMKQMGMKQKEIPAMRVIIETQDGNLVFENPSVTETQVQGQSTFQIMGKYAVEKQETEIVIPDEDVELVSSQAGVTKEAARKALEIAKGDLAQAIMDLQG